MGRTYICRIPTTFRRSTSMRLQVSRRLFALAALAIPAALAAQSTPQVKISYVTDSLPNGLHVIYTIDHSTPVDAVEVMYNVGSKSERPGKTGFARSEERRVGKECRGQGAAENETRRTT